MDKLLMKNNTDANLCVSNRRDSNIELMRIVIMFFIVFLHFITNAELLGEGAPEQTFMLVNTIRGFLLIAVNCFILISGYYGIKFKLRGILRLYLTTFFFGLIAYLIHLFVDGQHLGVSLLYNSVFCISSSKLWFIPCYFALYCIAPILNYAIDGMDKKAYLYALVSLTVLNVYFGYFWQNKYFNVSCFSIAQMVYMYFIGGYLRRFLDGDSIVQRRWLSLATYFVITLLWSLISYTDHKILIPHWHSNIYNNPAVIISSIAFFLFFKSIRFHSRAINYLAKGVLAV